MRCEDERKTQEAFQLSPRGARARRAGRVVSVGRARAVPDVPDGVGARRRGGGADAELRHRRPARPARRDLLLHLRRRLQEGERRGRAVPRALASGSELSVLCVLRAYFAPLHPLNRRGAKWTRRTRTSIYIWLTN